MKCRCIDCACCDAENMACYPNNRDCEAYYALDKEDLYTKQNCDFFISINGGKEE